MDFLPSNCIDLVVTSPPYDYHRKYKGFVFDYRPVGIELFRVISIGGVLVWVVNDQVINNSESGTSFKQALYFMELGFKLHDTMIFRKTNFMPTNHKRYEQEFEYMFVFVKGKIKTFNPIRVRCKYAGAKNWGDRSFYHGSDNKTKKPAITIGEFKNNGNIFEYATGSVLKSYGHPAPFPLQLAADHISTWSNPGDTVYDPFSGSGTTLEAAKKSGRNYIGSEISKEYCDIIKQRLTI